MSEKKPSKNNPPLKIEGSLDDVLRASVKNKNDNYMGVQKNKLFKHIKTGVVYEVIEVTKWTDMTIITACRVDAPHSCIADRIEIFVANYSPVN